MLSAFTAIPLCVYVVPEYNGCVSSAAYTKHPKCASSLPSANAFSSIHIGSGHSEIWDPSRVEIVQCVLHALKAHAMADCAARAPAPGASKIPAHIAHPPHTAKPTDGEIVGHAQVCPAAFGIIAMPVLDLGVSIDRSIMPLLLSRLFACQMCHT